MSPTFAEAALHYAKLQINTASHPKRICMLHSRCAELTVIAEAEKNPAKRRIILDKAQNILAQLQAVLQVDDTVSRSLFYLYDYCYVLLGRGESADCIQSRQILVTLRDTFEQLFRTI